jgi:arsenate reductase
VPKLHISFLDPATAEGTDEEKMAIFRRVRDEIRDRLVPEVCARG